ncbi:MAG: type II toxin-antitoxin system RelE/ParE family toxin [Candidatus Stahlbacteria bacterium]|nr:type II toxin-antitoxin system RelE/ParE family toxin [Candidatus Stahlbacteria bacterium]
MAQRVKWTEVDWSDIERVADYIAKDSPYYAAAFVREVRDIARSLAYLSERGRTLPEFGDPTVRELFVKKYRLIYQVRGQTVYVIGFIHGSRDLLMLWEQEKRSNDRNIS